MTVRGRLLAFGFWLLVFGFWLSAFANIADRIVAVVGDKIILKSEVEQLVTFVRLSTGDTLTPDSILQEEARRRLIDEALLQTEAIRESVEVGRDEIATEVAKSIASLKERFESEEEFAAALGEEGLSEKMLKERIGEEVRKNLLARRLLEKKGLMQIYISPAEAEQFYNEHKDSIAFLPGRVSLAHILIPITPSESAEAEVQRRAWEVIDLLSRGGDFATLARSFSDDPKTKERGGDWGFRNEEEIPLDLGMVLTQLKPGQISPPFRTQDGYLIAKLEAREKKRWHFRTILFSLKTTHTDTVRARRLALSVKNKALSGVPFDSLAKLYSADPESKKSGGYLGQFFLEGLTPPFDKVIAGMDSGDISDPVLSEHGFHIIKLLAKEPARTLSFLEIQDAIRNYLYQERFTERLRQYLDRIERTVYVEIKKNDN